MRVGQCIYGHDAFGPFCNIAHRAVDDETTNFSCDCQRSHQAANKRLRYIRTPVDHQDVAGLRDYDGHMNHQIVAWARSNRERWSAHRQRKRTVVRP